MDHYHDPEFGQKHADTTLTEQQRSLESKETCVGMHYHATEVAVQLTGVPMV